MHFALAFQPQPQPQPVWLGLAADDAVVDDEGAPATSSGWSSLFTPVGAVISEEEQIEVVPLTHAFVMQCNSIVGAGASLSRAPPACSLCCLFACGLSARHSAPPQLSGSGARVWASMLT